MPATDTIDFEHEFGDLVAELRALPTAAPAPVRERVRAFGEPAQPVTLWDRVRGIAWRRVAPRACAGLRCRRSRGVCDSRRCELEPAARSSAHRTR